MGRRYSKSLDIGGSGAGTTGDDGVGFWEILDGAFEEVVADA